MRKPYMLRRLNDLNINNHSPKNYLVGLTMV